MRIWVDTDRLAAYQLTVQDVEDALRRQNLEVPAGRIESQQREFSVTARTDLNTVAQFNEIALKTAGGHNRAPARRRAGGRGLRPASARVCDSTACRRSARHHPQRDRQSARGRRRRAGADAQIQRELPPSVTVHQANDNSVFIDRSIKAVYTTVAEAVLLVALVVFVFLRTLRASIIPLVTIPVSLIGAFSLIALAGFTVNTLTAAGTRAGHRSGGRRRHRRAREYLPPHRGGPDAAAGLVQGHPRDQFRGGGDDAHAGGGVRAAGLHARAHRAPVQRIRAHAGRCGAGVGFCRADADTDAVQQAACATTRGRRGSTAAWRPCSWR